MSDIPTFRGLSPKLLQRLGLIVIQWSIIDGTLSIAFANLCCANPGSLYVATESVSMDAKIRWLRTNIKAIMGDAPGRKLSLDLLAHIEDLKATRNAWVHGVWDKGPEPDTALVQTIRMDRSPALTQELVTLADLDEFAALLDDVSTEVVEFLHGMAATGKIAREKSTG